MNDELDRKLRNLDDKLVSQCLVAVIDIICFFCEQATKEGVAKNNLFEEVSNQLDQAGRDDALFRCLLIYDDDVRGSVVKCLLKVPMTQFEDEEVGKIIELL